MRPADVVSRLLPATLAFALMAATAATGLTGCGERPAPPPPPPPAKPTSNWTTAHSQDVAKALADDAVGQQWVIAFRTKAGRLARVFVDEIQDRSGDHVDVAELAVELEKALFQSQQVAVVKTREAADFLLTGAIGREAVAGGGRYAVDARLATPDGDPVWVYGVERTIAAPESP